MAKEQIEYSLVVDESDAVKGIEKTDKAQTKLEGTVKKTNDSIIQSWTKVGSAIGSAIIAFETFSKARDYEKQFRLLTDSNKKLALQIATTTDFTTEMATGFVQTAQSAGLTTEQIKKMTDQAIALGRLYPHESTETFIDNLSMLNTTGEAQGFIVDVLEQKYKSLDIQQLSMAEKLQAIDEVTKGVNEKYNAQGGFLDKIYMNAKKALSATIEFVMGTTTALSQQEERKKLLKEIAELEEGSWYKSKSQEEAGIRLRKQRLTQLDKEIAKTKELENLKGGSTGANKTEYDYYAEDWDKIEDLKDQAIYNDQSRLNDRIAQEEAYTDWLLEEEEKRNQALMNYRQEESDDWADAEDEKDKKAYEYSKNQEQAEKDAQLQRRQTVDTYMQLGATLTSAMNVNNKRDFENKKKMEMALTSIATARAVTQALPNVPMAVAIGAMGFVQLGVIASQQYSARELGGTTIKNRPYLVGERGPEMFVPEGNGNIIPNKDLTGGNSNVNVILNISAMDTKGFENVLADKRNLKVLTQAVAKGINKGY